MNEPNINYSHTYPVGEESNWVDNNYSQTDESEFDLPVTEENTVKPSVEIANKLNELTSYLANLNQQFSDCLSKDAAKDKAFEYLYSELETVKQNSSFERFKPLYLDLILLFDRLDRVCWEHQSAEDMSNFLSTLREELLEVLYRQGIELVITDGNTFDPTKQRAIGTEKTEVKEENNTLAAIIRRGFRYQNRPIRPEEVIVKKYRG